MRPSGNVIAGRPPPYVVILLDGIAEFKPGFRMDPYRPTNPGDPASYCPENVNAAGKPVPNDFPHEGKGPWEFFRKWNYYDPSDTENHNIPSMNSNSTPRYIGRPLPLGAARFLRSGDKTHQFMLDAIAATGAVILPFSYTAAALQARRNADPQFIFHAYTACNSGGILLCDRNPGGNPSVPSRLAARNFSIDEDAAKLDLEVLSIRKVWPNVPVVIVGHSQGGLIAFYAWYYRTKAGLILPPVQHLFSMDSPINGVCARFAGSRCLGQPLGYPEFESRVARDRAVLSTDRTRGDPFRFIGTWGDSVQVTFYIPGTHRTISSPAYGTGDETLQHELLVRGPRCVSSGRDRDCPDAPSGPDHISECRIPGGGWIKDDQHFIVKFCPGNVEFFNRVLGLVY